MRAEMSVDVVYGLLIESNCMQINILNITNDCNIKLMTNYFRSLAVPINTLNIYEKLSLNIFIHTCICLYKYISEFFFFVDPMFLFYASHFRLVHIRTQTILLYKAKTKRR